MVLQNKSRIAVGVLIIVIIAMLIPASVSAAPPGPPTGFRPRGTIRAGQVAVLRSGMYRVKITTRPALGPRVKVSYRLYKRVWRRGLPLTLYLGGGTKTFWYLGQGTGGYVTNNVYFRCYTNSCAVGSGGLYARRSWTRRR